MGCCSGTKRVIYSKYEKAEVKDLKDDSYHGGPFINNTVNSFEQIETSYKDKTYIEELLKAFNENKVTTV